jgi:hypothetical protein
VILSYAIAGFNSSRWSPSMCSRTGLVRAFGGAGFDVEDEDPGRGDLVAAGLISTA